MKPYIFGHRFMNHAIVLGLAFAIAMPAMAVNPSLGEILPRGGQLGTQVEVNFHGNNLGDAQEIMFHDPGLSVASLEVVNDKHVKCMIDVAADASVGLRGCRVRTATGMSNLRLFSVGPLTELAEAEPNSEFETAQVIALNSTVNGTITNEDVDYYSFDLEAGQRVSVEIEAIRLGGVLFDAKVRLFGPGGHERMAQDDSAAAKQDVVFTFTTEETGPHRVAVSESSYGGAGNFRYRLHVGTFPRPLAMSPMGGQPESQVEVLWLGDPALTKQPITVPAVTLGTQPIVPTDETGASPTPVPFRVSNLPGTMEVEPNANKDQATLGTAPGAFDGIIGEPGDEDWFAFQGTKDQVFECRVWARHLGSPLDSVLTLIKPSGGAVASDDDAAGVDSTFRATLPEDGVYQLVVRDHLRRGGPTFAYRIEVSPIEPKLSFSLVENEDVQVNVPQGGRTFLHLAVSRSDFDGPLDLTWLNLPEGVRMEHPPIAQGQTRIPVIMHAASTMPVTGSLIGIDARLAAENSTVSGGFDQTIPLTYGRNKTVFCDRQVDRIATSFTSAAPFTIDMVKPNSPGVKGANKTITIVAKRADGFEGEIPLRFPWLPGGFGGGTAKIPAKQDRVNINLEIRGNAGVGDHNLVVEANAGGYKICTPFTPVAVSDPFFTVSMPEISIEQGQQAELVIPFNQVTPFEGEYTLEFHGLPKGVTTEHLTFNKETKELKQTIVAAADAPPGKHAAPRMLATLKINGEDVRHIFGGAQVTVFKPLPAELQQPEKPKEEKKPDQPERKTRFGTD